MGKKNDKGNIFFIEEEKLKKVKKVVVIEGKKSYN